MYQRWCGGSCGIEDGEGACRDFDPLDFLTAKDARRADRFTQLALAAAVEALADAGWDHELPAPSERVGCVLGIGIGGLATMADGQDAVRERGEAAVSPLAVPRMMSNAAPAWISMRFGLEGPTQSVGTACASGANALGCALRMLQVGRSGRRRRRRLRGHAHTTRPWRLRGARRPLGERHLTAVRRETRRVRAGGGGRDPRARAPGRRARARRALLRHAQGVRGEL